MRRSIFTLFCATMIAVSAGACATSSPQATQAKAEPAAAMTQVPADSKLAAIKKGMSDTDVRRILGEPSSSNDYMTGKSWIPFYYGPDTHRKDYVYSGVGRVVFSRNRYSQGLKVINVVHDPSL